LIHTTINHEDSNMNKANRSSEAASVNLSELLARVDNDRALLCELLSIFKREFPDHLQALRNAVAGNDADQAARVSHTLKGMLANLAVARRPLPLAAQSGSLAPECSRHWAALLQVLKKTSKDCSLKWRATWPRRACEDSNRR
jgi:Hpt domain